MMKIELENVLPREIEKRSFELITEELGERTFPEEQEPIIKRCIHTSADFDYADNLCFSEGVVEKAKEAIRNGACIVTDTADGKIRKSIRKNWQHTAEKSSALCQMKMWQRQQRKTGRQEQLPVWTRRQP